MEKLQLLCRNDIQFNRIDLENPAAVSRLFRRQNCCYSKTVHAFFTALTKFSGKNIFFRLGSQPVPFLVIFRVGAFLCLGNAAAEKSLS